MKRAIAILIIFALVVMIVPLTGCIDEPTEDIKGMVYNRSDYRIEMRITGTHSVNMFLAPGRPKELTLQKPGAYLIKTYDADQETHELGYLTECEMVIERADTTFGINIYNTTIDAAAISTT